MKVLITGSAGFIGYHLTNKLLERGDEVVGLDNINDYYDVNLKFDRLQDAGIVRQEIVWNKKVRSKTYSKYSFYRANLQDKEFIAELFEKEKFDKVVNLAGQAGVRYSLVNPHAYIESNVIGFLNVLEGCRHNNVKHLAYASSSSVYGLNETMPLSENDNVDHPVSLYASTKKSNELMAHSYSHLFGIPTTGLRFFTVYGPWGRPDMALFLFTEAMLKGKPINVFNHGKMIRDFTYISDIIEGMQRVVDNPPCGNPIWDGANPSPSSSKAPYRVFNLGNSNPVKLMDFIHAIENKIGILADKKFMDFQPGDVQMTNADITNLETMFDYKPNTQVQEGVNNFVDWYQAYYNRPSKSLIKRSRPVYSSYAKVVREMAFRLF